ncbi:hypothetical protein MASR2M78_07920 [Treponema sp.]
MLIQNMNDTHRVVAVIEIGSTGIRLVVAEIEKNGDWRVIDRAGKPLALGRDVFTSGSISRESLMACLGVLQGYKELITGWGIQPMKLKSSQQAHSEKPATETPL